MSQPWPLKEEIEPTRVSTWRGYYPVWLGIYDETGKEYHMRKPCYRYSDWLIYKENNYWVLEFKRHGPLVFIGKFRTLTIARSILAHWHGRFEVGPARVVDYLERDKSSAYAPIHLEIFTRIIDWREIVDGYELS